jgi:hypothetical protein
MEYLPVLPMITVAAILLIGVPYQLEKALIKAEGGEEL